MSNADEEARRDDRGTEDEVVADTVDADAPGSVEATAGEDEGALRDQYLRLAADFENFKRRRNQEALDRARYASADAVLALLPVLDNLQRSLEHAPAQSDADGNFLTGIQMVVRDFESALAALGVTVIPTVGEPFDPSVHEAIGGEESPGVTIDTVTAEFQRGYRLHDRVLRPAMVRVAHPA